MKTIEELQKELHFANEMIDSYHHEAEDLEALKAEMAAMPTGPWNGGVLPDDGSIKWVLLDQVEAPGHYYLLKWNSSISHWCRPSGDIYYFGYPYVWAEIKEPRP